MDLEKEKIIKAKEILNKIANGFNPVNGAPIDADCFLQDPRIIRCLFFVQQVLNEVVEGSINRNSRKIDRFVITAEEKSQVQFPQENIGVNQFARCINSVIDLNRSRKISGVEINRQLKKMGILAEEQLDDGKKRTAINENSCKYGIVTEKRSYNGNEYDMVCFNDIGKKFLLDDLEKILEYDANS
ncbi:MAG: hypothetical protein ABFD08_11875 [Syntrophomonas sp.]